MIDLKLKFIKELDGFMTRNLAHQEDVSKMPVGKTQYDSMMILHLQLEILMLFER